MPLFYKWKKIDGYAATGVYIFPEPSTPSIHAISSVINFLLPPSFRDSLQASITTRFGRDGILMLYNNQLSISYKISELKYLASSRRFHLVSCTENLLISCTLNSDILFLVFSLLQKDSPLGIHGGVIAFIDNFVPLTLLSVTSPHLATSFVFAYLLIIRNICYWALSFTPFQRGETQLYSNCTHSLSYFLLPIFSFSIIGEL